MITPIPIQTNSCPCCAGDMPVWVTIVVLSVIAFLLIIAIPIWYDIAKSAINKTSGDGFNERRAFISNSNGMNHVNKNAKFDNSLSKMRVFENKPDVETAGVNENTQNFDPNDPQRLKTNVEMCNTFKRNTQTIMTTNCICI